MYLNNLRDLEAVIRKEVSKLKNEIDAYMKQQQEEKELDVVKQTQIKKQQLAEANADVSKENKEHDAEILLTKSADKKLRKIEQTIDLLAGSIVQEESAQGDN